MIAGGTNDFHGDLPPLEQWISDNLNFMDEVRATTVAAVAGSPSDAASCHVMHPLSVYSGRHGLSQVTAYVHYDVLGGLHPTFITHRL